MQLQVRSGSFELSPEMIARMRETADELEALYPELLSCRFTIEAGSGRGNAPFRVKLELHVPGVVIPVAHQQADTLPKALEFAFAAAITEVEEYRRTRARLSREVA